MATLKTQRNLERKYFNELLKHNRDAALNIRYIKANEIDALKSPELAKFVNKYGFSLKEENQESTLDYILKGRNITRIINAIRMKRVIEMYNLDHLHVVDKFLDLSEDFLVIKAEKVKCCSLRKFSLIDVQQLAKLAEETGYSDWGGDYLSNIFINENDQITFIDTEDKSFGFYNDGIFSAAYYYKLVPEIINEAWSCGCKLKYITNLSKLYSCMEPDAQQWYRNRVKELNTPEGLVYKSHIYDNNQYDSPEIDLQKVKEEWRCLGMHQYEKLRNEIKLDAKNKEDIERDRLFSAWNNSH